MKEQQAKLFIAGPVIPANSYPGRKGAAGTWQKIVSNIPKCDLFIDAMCGSGIIGSLVKNCQIFFNDLDPAVIDRIKVNSEYAFFLNEHYKEIVKRYDNGNKGRVFYFDPPYIMNTRSYQQDIYKYDWSKKEHEEFLKVILKMKSNVMVSHYPCDFYDKGLKKWRKITYNAITRAGVRKESLYMNFPQPVLLQCPDHIGENFTDRQRIKRKVERHINRLKNETDQERAAILTKIIEHFSYVDSTKKD